ncbi:MAG: LacI family transcriptional regulator, partial [Candidatus Pacebacteria bacterium]|nr:LacI family transcriptional regulator [Candidatus Paceibacterota bacterium]
KNVIAKTDYHLHIFGINSSARSFLMTDGDQRWADLLDPSRLEGVIVIPREADPAQVEYLASLLPVVWMDLPAVHGELAGVRLDYLGAGFSAGKHLLDLGHRTIALATLKTGDPAWLDRDSGIRLAIRGAGKEKTCTYKRYNAKSFCEAEGYRLGNEYLNDASRPTAVICSSDELAVGFYRAVCKAGLTVPKDVSLIGWNDTLTTDDIPIPLTSVHMHYEAAGVRCAEKLLELLRHPQTTDDVEEIPADLIVRESTAAPTG